MLIVSILFWMLIHHWHSCRRVAWGPRCSTSQSECHRETISDHCSGISYQSLIPISPSFSVSPAGLRNWGRFVGSPHHRTDKKQTQARCGYHSAWLSSEPHHCPPWSPQGTCFPQQGKWHADLWPNTAGSNWIGSRPKYAHTCSWEDECLVIQDWWSCEG